MKSKRVIKDLHNHEGNCWSGLGAEDDVCMLHEEPRGECDRCSRCEKCEIVSAIASVKGCR